MGFVGNSFLVAGDESAAGEIRALLGKEGIDTEGNADVYTRAYAHFGIDEAHEIRDRSGSRGLAGRRVFILSMPGMTTEAQNALLKTLEEPSGEALFFLIMPSPEMLLPTLRSRMQALDIARSARVEIIDSKEFLRSAPARRLDMLKPLLEKDDDEKRDLGGIITFLSSLEATLGKGDDREGLDAVYRARKYLGDKGSLVKPLLEQVALLVPIMKT